MKGPPMTTPTRPAPPASLPFTRTHKTRYPNQSVLCATTDPSSPPPRPPLATPAAPPPPPPLRLMGAQQTRGAPRTSPKSSPGNHGRCRGGCFTRLQSRTGEVVVRNAAACVVLCGHATTPGRDNAAEHRRDGPTRPPPRTRAKQGPTTPQQPPTALSPPPLDDQAHTHRPFPTPSARTWRRKAGRGQGGTRGRATTRWRGRRGVDDPLDSQRGCVGERRCFRHHVAALAAGGCVHARVPRPPQESETARPSAGDVGPPLPLVLRVHL